jgi:hypothetical protein
MNRKLFALVGISAAAAALGAVLDARATTLGDDVTGVADANLPDIRTILSVDRVIADSDICECLQGWAQNWGDEKHDHFQRYPAIGVYDEGGILPDGRGSPEAVPICPSLQVGRDFGGNRVALRPRSFSVPPLVPELAAGHYIAVEVDIKGVGGVKGGGTLWNKVVTAPPGQCPPTVSTGPLPVGPADPR